MAPGGELGWLLIGVITNLNAGRLRRQPELRRRVLAVRADNLHHIATGHADETPAALRALLERGATRIAICGGDGAFGRLIDQLQKDHPVGCPRLAVLPAGTMNTVAGNLGVRGDPARLLSRLVQAEASGTLRDRNCATLLVNKRVGFIFAAAMAAEFVSLYYRRGASRSTAVRLALEIPWAAVWGHRLAQRLFRPVAGTIEVDKTRLPMRRFTLLVASTVENLGLGVRLAYRARQRVDRFHLVASGLPARSLALQFPRTFAGKPLVGRGHADCLASTVDIHFSQPRPFVLDGELHRAQRIKLRRGPRFEIWSL